MVTLKLQYHSQMCNKSFSFTVVPEQFHFIVYTQVPMLYVIHKIEQHLPFLSLICLDRLVNVVYQCINLSKSFVSCQYITVVQIDYE